MAQNLPGGQISPTLSYHFFSFLSIYTGLINKNFGIRNLHLKNIIVYDSLADLHATNFTCIYFIERLEKIYKNGFALQFTATRFPRLDFQV